MHRAPPAQVRILPVSTTDPSALRRIILSMHVEATLLQQLLPLGLEPRTFRLLAECSNQLSYESTEN